MKRICTICARGGSTGVKGKNIRRLLDKPLIAHSILQAKKAGIFHTVAVSSDSKEILAIANEWGADITIERPHHLATEFAAKLPVIQHCVLEAEVVAKNQFDIVVDLDVTAPLRLVSDIIGVINLLENSNASSVLTGMIARKSPYFNLVELNDAGFIRLCKPTSVVIERRQDSPRCFDLNGSVYAWKKEKLLEGNSLKSVFNGDTLLYEMPEERSYDIDTELDFEVVELLAKRRVSLT